MPKLWIFAARPIYHTQSIAPEPLSLNTMMVSPLPNSFFHSELRCNSEPRVDLPSRNFELSVNQEVVFIKENRSFNSSEMLKDFS